MGYEVTRKSQSGSCCWCSSLTVRCYTSFDSFDTIDIRMNEPISRRRRLTSCSRLYCLLISLWVMSQATWYHSNSSSRVPVARSNCTLSCSLFCRVRTCGFPYLPLFTADTKGQMSCWWTQRPHSSPWKNYTTLVSLYGGFSLILTSSKLYIQTKMYSYNHLQWGWMNIFALL